MTETLETPETENTSACHPHDHPLKKVRKHGVGLWGNARVKKSYRVDEGIYNASKPVKIRYFGSVCRANELFDLALIAMDYACRLGDVDGVPRVVDGPIKIDMHVVREMQPHRKLKAGEILPVETRLNEAVERTYGEFRASKLFPALENVREFVRGECGIVGLDNKAVVNNVLGRIREDRRS